ncbi:hypothetical protein [Kordia zhangzhouensis]|uniref:hypothetical protein n=1 Tax=Kordia zhangzhouensis TaxID=1620405 RepID=UPI0012FBD3AD|nr:hypothetical protein [Kordia zhangzhouensis]
MKNIFILLIFLTWYTILSAQNSKSVVLNQGQIFDVLPLKFNKEADSLSMRKYLKDSVLPRAIELGYIPISSIPINKNAIQGNYTPDIIVLGAWKNKASLDRIMKQLEFEFPDFHSLRREIWTIFYNTHYELKEDLSFEFLSNKFYVATAYWKKQSSDFQKFKEKTTNNIYKHKGKMILELSKGESPYGYYYNPDCFLITEWNNRVEFIEFMKVNHLEEQQNLKHINQFELSIK